MYFVTTKITVIDLEQYEEGGMWERGYQPGKFNLLCFIYTVHTIQQNIEFLGFFADQRTH